MKRPGPGKESAPILKFDTGIGTGCPVVRSWSFELSWKEQTVLLTSLRGPDGLASEGVRDIIRWIRSTLIFNADATSGYMIEELRPNWRLGSDLGPPHFIEHLLLCLKVIERRHPTLIVRERAESFRAHLKVAFKELYHEEPRDEEPESRRE